LLHVERLGPGLGTSVRYEPDGNKRKVLGLALGGAGEKRP